MRPMWRGWVLFLTVASCAMLLGGEAMRAAYVAKLAESDDPAILRRVVALDPTNPKLYHRLGMVLCTFSGEACRSEGLLDLRRATELDPRTAQYWTDLAWVCEMTGDPGCSTKCVEQAVKVSPTTPQVRWLAANTLLRAGQKDAAMAEFRRLLELDPTYAPATFHVCMGALGDPQLILERVLPLGRDPSLKLAYLSFLRTNEQDDLAAQVWRQVVQTGTPFPFASAAPYIEHLLALGSFSQAQQAWHDLERLGVIPSPPAGESENLVYNGDFETAPLNSGLDWRDQPASYIALDFADSSAHTGAHCLRIDFTVGRNEEYFPLYEYVPVSSNRSFLLTAFVRSQDITSDSGPRLEVEDPIHQGASRAVSETTLGTTPWHQINLDFCTGPETNVVQLSVKRVRSRTYPTEISGSFWLDTVVMKPLGEASESACVSSH